MNLLEELFRAQEPRGYLRDEDLESLSARLRVPLYQLQGLTSFYPHLRRAPRAPLKVEVCRDLCCHLRGASAQLERVRELASGRDDVVIEAVSCLGLCDQAPACRLSERPASCDQIEAYLAGEKLAAPVPTPGRIWQMDPYPGGDERYGELRNWVARDDPTELIARLEASGLRGMGGAGFPTGPQVGARARRGGQSALRDLQRRRERAGYLQGPGPPRSATPSRDRGHRTRRARSWRRGRLGLHSPRVCKPARTARGRDPGCAHAGGAGKRHLRVGTALRTAPLHLPRRLCAGR